MTNPRYRVVSRVPLTLRDLGFVAFVEDAEHPDGGALSLSWHQGLFDAERVAEAMNYRGSQDGVVTIASKQPTPERA